MPGLSRWVGQQRLRAVAMMIPQGARVAEIGTDHGRLPRRLLAAGRASFCIASELTEKALRRVRSFPLGHPLRERMSLRAGRGLGVLRPEDRVDVLVLAGMGAARIRSIVQVPRLQELGIRRLVLQPQHEPAALRGWLLRNGWTIVEERMALERGRFYVVLAAEPGGGGPDALRHPLLSREELLEAGPCLVRSRDPLVRRFWLDRLQLYEGALARARASRARERIRRRRDSVIRILEALPSPETSPGAGVQ